MSSQCLFILGVSFSTPSEPSFLELAGCPGHRQVPEPFERTRVVPAMDFSVTAVTRFYPDESQLFEPSKPALYRAATNSEFLLQSAVPLPVGVWAEDAKVCVKFFCRSVELLDVHIPHPLRHVMVCFSFGHSRNPFREIIFFSLRTTRLDDMICVIRSNPDYRQGTPTLSRKSGFFFCSAAGVRRVVDIFSLEITAHPGAWRVL